MIFWLWVNHWEFKLVILVEIWCFGLLMELLITEKHLHQCDSRLRSAKTSKVQSLRRNVLFTHQPHTIQSKCQKESGDYLLCSDKRWVLHLPVVEEMTLPVMERWHLDLRGWIGTYLANRQSGAFVVAQACGILYWVWDCSLWNTELGVFGKNSWYWMERRTPPFFSAIFCCSYTFIGLSNRGDWCPKKVDNMANFDLSLSKLYRTCVISWTWKLIPSMEGLLEKSPRDWISPPSRLLSLSLPPSFSPFSPVSCSLSHS